MPKQRSAFTLVEILIVVVIMAVLAATIIPQFSDSTVDAKESALIYDLHTLRAQIELFRLHHNGVLPTVADDADGQPSLPQLYSRTDEDGTIGTDKDDFPFGPYVVTDIPRNPFNGNSNFITELTVWPPTAETTDGGWFYNPDTGQVAANADEYLDR
jgi:prepilin-type N-terminal cleavage/methylation domain-containing protein